MIYNDLQMKILEQFEKIFAQAVYQNTLISLPRPILDKMMDITGNEKNINFNCGSCVFNMVKNIGADYFLTKKRMESEIGELIEINEIKPIKIEPIKIESVEIEEPEEPEETDTKIKKKKNESRIS